MYHTFYFCFFGRKACKYVPEFLQHSHICPRTLLFLCWILFSIKYLLYAVQYVNLGGFWGGGRSGLGMIFSMFSAWKRTPRVDTAMSAPDCYPPPPPLYTCSHGYQTSNKRNKHYLFPPACLFPAPPFPPPLIPFPFQISPPLPPPVSKKFPPFPKCLIPYF